jgi:hypothetical protein
MVREPVAVSSMVASATGAARDAGIMEIIIIRERIIAKIFFIVKISFHSKNKFVRNSNEFGFEQKENRGVLFLGKNGLFSFLLSQPE